MLFKFLKSNSPKLKTLVAIFFALLCIFFLQPHAYASSPLINKLQIPGLLLKSAQAFTNYQKHNAQKLEARITEAVCLKDMTPLPLPSQTEIFPYLEHEKIIAPLSKEQAYAMFVKFYMNFCINLRINQEACWADPTCGQSLCRNYHQPSQKNTNATSLTEQNGQAGSLEEVYDINARDLIAIP